MQKRILVHLKRGSADACFAQFTQSVVDTFGGRNDTSSVYVKLHDNKLLLSDELGSDDCRLVQIKRPAFCPIRALTPAVVSQLPLTTRDRGIDVGCALILETCDGQVLLTRRAAHLRTFPGVWVPPGGHLEENETLTEACLRELKEETGLDISPTDCLRHTLYTLALWESTYPPMLSHGNPVRHHVVVYMYCKLLEPKSCARLQSCLRLDVTEVGAATWLTRSMIAAVTAVMDDERPAAAAASCNTPADFPPTIVVTEVVAGVEHVDRSVGSEVLLNTAPASGTDVERVSTGTKFALQQWLTATALTT